MQCRIYADEAEWRARRMASIGASEVAVLLGKHPFMSAKTLWRLKTDAGFSLPVSDAAELGSFCESLIFEKFKRRTHLTVEYLGGRAVSALDKYPRLHASLDGWATHETEGEVVVDAKMTGEELEELPKYWRLQGLVQASLAETPRAGFIVLQREPVKLRSFDAESFLEVERNEEIVEALSELADRFWADHVEPRIEPEEWNPPLPECLSSLFAPPEIVAECTLPHNYAATVMAYRAARAQEKAAKTEAEGLRDLLLAGIGNAAQGRVEGTDIIIKVQRTPPGPPYMVTLKKTKTTLRINGDED